jgi:predicted phage-related endonuclease
MSLLYPKTREEWLALRHKYVSSTDSPSLFDVGYNTRLGLYYSKLEEQPTSFEGTERMEMGIALERAIATYIARKFGVMVRAFNAYAARNSRMGASFDFQIFGEDVNVKDVEDDSLRIMYREFGVGVLEIKNVDYFIFKQEWVQDNGTGSYEAPAHIEIQVQHQLHCCERNWAAIGVCVGGNRLEVLIRKRDEHIGTTIEKRVMLFWDWIDKKTPPPEKMPDDWELLKKVYSHAEPDNVLDASGKPEVIRLMKVYATAAKKIKELDEQKKAAQADLLKIIGTASKVVTPVGTISCGVISKEAYTVEPVSYRSWRVTMKKERVPETKPTEETTSEQAG